MRRLFALAISMALMVPLMAGSAGAASDMGDLSVIHGIPGATVDVYANDALLLPGFESGDVAGPLTLPTGNYDVDIYTAGDDPMTDPAIVSASVELVPGGSVSAIAHLDALGAPTITAYVNDLSSAAVSQGRLVVRHTAAAPAVDIVVTGVGAILSNVENPQSGQLDVAAATYPVTINAAGTSDVAFDAGDVPITEGEALHVYAIGDLVGGTFGLVLQSFDLASPDGYGELSVVHGIPGLPVDVYLNGVLAIPGFQPETIVENLLVAAGDYDVALYAEGADPLTTAPALVASTTLPAGANASAVAHLDEVGTPTFSVFVNDLSTIDAGNGRVVVRHTAAAPSVDVLADGGVLIPGLTNPDEAQADVPAATYSVELTPAGMATVVFGPTDLPVTEGESIVVYAIGDLGAATFTLITQSFGDLGPSGAFTDDDNSVHEVNINTIARVGITTGKTADDFGPTDSVTRGQMAAFLNRALGLPASSVDAFSDDDGTTFESDINAIAAVGITQATGTFGPGENVTRGQMAAFLVRAFDIPASSADAFPDDDGTTFESDINALAAAGVSVGQPDGTYGPSADVTRAQMATFIARAMGLGN